MNIYRRQIALGGCLYTIESTISMEDAEEEIYRRAFKRGHWEPRKLREEWWQFWRPTEHSKMEKLILNDGEEK